MEWKQAAKTSVMGNRRPASFNTRTRKINGTGRSTKTEGRATNTLISATKESMYVAQISEHNTKMRAVLPLEEQASFSGRS